MQRLRSPADEKNETFHGRSLLYGGNVVGLDEG